MRSNDFSQFCINYKSIINLKQKITQMKNIQRQSLQNCKTSTMPQAFSTQLEYFPTRCPNKQLRSVTQQSWNFKSELPEQYEKLAKMYQKENEQIIVKNNQLLEVVRELKDKQSGLLDEISSLQNYYRKLLNNYEQTQHNKQNQTINYESINTQQHITRQSQQKKVPIKNTGIEKEKQMRKSASIKGMYQQAKIKQQYVGQKVQAERQNFIKSLNDDFCKLVQQSINEKDSAKRKKLRKELAELAAEMKKIRNNHDSDLNFKEQSKQHYLTCKKQPIYFSPSNKTLAPYLETTDSEIVEKNITNDKHNYRNCNELDKLKNKALTNCVKL